MVIGPKFVYRRHLQEFVVSADTAAPSLALDHNSGNWRQAAFAQFSGTINGQLQDKPEDAPGPGMQHDHDQLPKLVMLIATTITIQS